MPVPTLYDDNDQAIKLPTHRIVCPRCHGNGEHVNPSIDGNGISTDDECWQDDDFREGYLSGRYNVTCEECHGRNVVDDVDWDALSDELRARLEAAYQEEADDLATRRAESGYQW